MTFNLVVAGSRDIKDSDFIFQFLDDYVRVCEEQGERPAKVITGGAQGVDQIAHAWATVRGYETKVINAIWALGYNAGKLRNKEMAAQGDELVAFWDGMSPGTAHMIATMVSLDKPVELVLYDQLEKKAK